MSGPMVAALDGMALLAVVPPWNSLMKLASVALYEPGVNELPIALGNASHLPVVAK